MNTDRFRYFAAVVETKNLRRAAELVGIAPASMSKAISMLETDYGVKLLRPEGRGIEVTKKGVEVYQQSRQLLEEVNRLERRLREPESPTSMLKVATFEVFSTYLMANALSSPRMSDSEVTVIERTPGDIELTIVNGLCDVGITYLPAADAKLDYIEVGSFKMGIFGLDEWKGINFSSWPFAIPVTEINIHTSLESALDLWPQSGPKRKIKYRFELLETALQTSRSGRSVIHCPDFIIEAHNADVRSSLHLQPLPLPQRYGPKVTKKVFLVTKKGAPTTELQRLLPKVFRSFARRSD